MPVPQTRGDAGHDAHACQTQTDARVCALVRLVLCQSWEKGERVHAGSQCVRLLRERVQVLH
eukprot:2117481-Rhodomonas_salina.3